MQPMMSQPEFAEGLILFRRQMAHNIALKLIETGTTARANVPQVAEDLANALYERLEARESGRVHGYERYVDNIRGKVAPEGELLASVRRVLEEVIASDLHTAPEDFTERICHRGLTTPEQCSKCGPIIRARIVLRLLDEQEKAR